MLISLYLTLAFISKKDKSLNYILFSI